MLPANANYANAVCTMHTVILDFFFLFLLSPAADFVHCSTRTIPNYCLDQRPKSSEASCQNQTRKFFFHPMKLSCKPFGICNEDADRYDLETELNYFQSMEECEDKCPGGMNDRASLHFRWACLCLSHVGVDRAVLLLKVQIAYLLYSCGMSNSTTHSKWCLQGWILWAWWYHYLLLFWRLWVGWLSKSNVPVEQQLAGSRTSLSR